MCKGRFFASLPLLLPLQILKKASASLLLPFLFLPTWRILKLQKNKWLRIFSGIQWKYFYWYPSLIFLEISAHVQDPLYWWNGIQVKFCSYFHNKLRPINDQGWRWIIFKPLSKDKFIPLNYQGWRLNIFQPLSKNLEILGKNEGSPKSAKTQPLPIWLKLSA